MYTKGFMSVKNRKFQYSQVELMLILHTVTSNSGPIKSAIIPRMHACMHICTKVISRHVARINIFKPAAAGMHLI